MTKLFTNYGNELKYFLEKSSKTEDCRSVTISWMSPFFPSLRWQPLILTFDNSVQRSIKYEEVFLKDYESLVEARNAIAAYNA